MRDERSTLQTEISAQYGADRESEEDPGVAQGHCPGEDHCPRARVERRDKVMAEIQAPGRRKELIGYVVSNRMQKTIVVEVVRRKSHPLYSRVISKAKKYYAHDEKNEAHLGGGVRLEERRAQTQHTCWQLQEIVGKTAPVPKGAA